MKRSVWMMIIIMLLVGGVVIYLIQPSGGARTSNTLSDRAKEFMATKQPERQKESSLLPAQRDAVAGVQLVTGCATFVTPFALLNIKEQTDEKSCAVSAHLKQPAALLMIAKKTSETILSDNPNVVMRLKNPDEYKQLEYVRDDEVPAFFFEGADHFTLFIQKQKDLLYTIAITDIQQKELLDREKLIELANGL